MRKKKKATKEKGASEVMSEVMPGKEAARAPVTSTREGEVEKAKTTVPEPEEKRGTKTHVEKMETVASETPKTTSKTEKKAVENPKNENESPMDRLTLIRLRHESMKKAIEQIREDLEVEADDLGIIVE